MDFRIIKAPSQATMDIIAARSRMKFEDKIPSAIGLVQGKLIDMVYASDIAQKTVGVEVVDVRGSCPQNMILLAICGDTSSVEEALKSIKESSGNKNVSL